MVEQKGCLVKTRLEKKELDRACAKGKWTDEGCAGGKNVGEETVR